MPWENLRVYRPSSHIPPPPSHIHTETFWKDTRAHTPVLLSRRHEHIRSSTTYMVCIFRNIAGVKHFRTVAICKACMYLYRCIHTTAMGGFLHARYYVVLVCMLTVRKDFWLGLALGLVIYFPIYLGARLCAWGLAYIYIPRDIDFHARRDS